MNYSSAHIFILCIIFFFLLDRRSNSVGHLFQLFEEVELKLNQNIALHNCMGKKSTGDFMIIIMSYFDE